MQNNIIFRFLLTNIFISKIFELHLHHYSLLLFLSLFKIIGYDKVGWGTKPHRLSILLFVTLHDLLHNRRR